MYADDHQLFSSAKLTNQAESILTMEESNISEWVQRSFTRNFFKVSGDESGPEELSEGLKTHRY